MFSGDSGETGSPEVPDYEASTPESANLKLAHTQEAALAKQADKEGSTEARRLPKGALASMRMYSSHETEVYRVPWL